MFLKIFLAAITVCSLLGCLGANRRDNKRIAAVVAIVGYLKGLHLQILSLQGTQ